MQTFQRGIQSCGFSRRGVRAPLFALSCRHLLVWVHTLGVAPFCPVLPIVFLFTSSCTLVAPVHHFLSQLVLICSLPIIPSSKLYSQAGQPVGLCPDGSHLFLAVLDPQRGSHCYIVPRAMQSFMSGMLQVSPGCCSVGEKTVKRMKCTFPPF